MTETCADKLDVVLTAGIDVQDKHVDVEYAVFNRKGCDVPEKRIEQLKEIARVASEMTGREISTYQIRWWMRRPHDRLPTERMFSRLSVAPSALKEWLDAHIVEHNPAVYVPRVTKTAKRLGAPVNDETAARLQELVKLHGERAAARILGPSPKTIRAAINGEPVLRVTAIAIAAGLLRAKRAQK